MKPILFIDFDGTICFDRFWNTAKISEEGIINNLIFGENLDLCVEWMKGLHTSEEINEKISQQLNIDEQKLWSLFIEGCESMKVEQSLLDSIHRLKDHYYVILLTDNMDCFDRFIVPNLKLELFFDEIVNSYNTGLLKRDNHGEIFLRKIKEQKAEISESVFLDNNSKNCELFRELGGRAFHIENNVEKYLNELLEKE